MKTFARSLPFVVFAGVAISGSASAQSCETFFTKGGAMQTIGCNNAAPVLSAPVSSLGAGSVLAPTIIQPIQPIAPLTPTPVEDFADIAPIIEDPVASVGDGENSFWVGVGGGAAQFGRSYSSNGIGGSNSSDTFGGSLSKGEVIWGANAGFGAKFGSFFARGSGLYGFGTDRWANGATYALVDGSTETLSAATDADITGNLIRANLSGGYSFDLGAEGISADVGPAISFVSANVETKLDSAAVDITEDRTVTTTAIGATAGISIAPTWRDQFSFWGHAAVQGYYGFGGYSLSQKVTGGTAASLTEANAATGNDTTGNKLTFGGEVAANAGYKISNSVLLGGGAYANYLGDMAILNGYDLDSTSLLDFGLRASLGLSF